MLGRLVARSNADLQRVIDRMGGFDGIVRASTAITLENPVPLRITPTGAPGVVAGAVWTADRWRTDLEAEPEK